MRERYADLRIAPDQGEGAHLVCTDADGACTEAVLGWRDKLDAATAHIHLATVVPLRRRS